MKQSRRPFFGPVMKIAEKKCPHCTFCANNKAVFEMHVKNLHDNIHEASKKIGDVNDDIDNDSDDDEPFYGFVGSEITEILSIPGIEEYENYEFDLTAPFPPDMNNCPGWFDGPIPKYSVKSKKENKSIDGGGEEEYSVKPEEQIIISKQSSISIEEFECQFSVKSEEQTIILKQEKKSIDECDFYGFTEVEIQNSTSEYTKIPLPNIKDVERFENYEFDLNAPFSSDMANCIGWFDGAIPEYFVTRPNPEEKSSEKSVNPKEKSLEKSMKPIPKESYYAENEISEDEDFHGFTDDEIRLTTTIIPIDEESMFENDQFDLTSPFPPDMNSCSGWHEEMPFKLI